MSDIKENYKLFIVNSVDPYYYLLFIFSIYYNTVRLLQTVCTGVQQYPRPSSLDCVYALMRVNIVIIGIRSMYSRIGIASIGISK